MLADNFYMLEITQINKIDLKNRIKE